MGDQRPALDQPTDRSHRNVQTVSDLLEREELDVIHGRRDGHAASVWSGAPWFLSRTRFETCVRSPERKSPSRTGDSAARLDVREFGSRRGLPSIAATRKRSASPRRLRPIAGTAGANPAPLARAQSALGACEPPGARPPWANHERANAWPTASGRPSSAPAFPKLGRTPVAGGGSPSRLAPASTRAAADAIVGRVGWRCDARGRGAGRARAVGRRPATLARPTLLARMTEIRNHAPHDGNRREIHGDAGHRHVTQA